MNHPKLNPTLSTPWGTLPLLGYMRLPHKWKSILPPSFRVLEWAYPRYRGSERVGLFECMVENYETRCQKVYMWTRGGAMLLTVGRPGNILPADPTPIKVKTEKPRAPGYNPRHILCIPKKRSPCDFVRVTFHHRNEFVFQRYYYGQQQELVKTKEIVPCQPPQTSDGEFESSESSAEISTSSGDEEDGWPVWETSTDLSDVKVSIFYRPHLSFEQTVIGEGAFGKVSLGTLAGTHKVAVKSFDSELSTSDDILKEAKLLAYLSDTGYVPKLFGVSYGDDFRLSIIQEYYRDGVTLFDVLHDCYNLPDSQWMKILRQLAEGLRAIHLKGVLLNDLKDDNVLVDCQSGNYVVRFIDFGLATFYESRVYHVSPEERHLRTQLAPEVKDGQPTSPSSDVYSLGRILENISFQCDICGLCDIADACLGSADLRPTTDEVISMIADLNKNITEEEF